MLTDPLGHLGDLAAAAWAAATSGHYALVAMLALLIAVALGRKYLPFPFLQTDLGAVAFTFALGTVGAVVAALTAGANPMSWAMLLAAMKVALGAMGGFAAIKKALLPLAVMALHAMGIQTSEGAKAVLAKATAAGDAAVAAKPATGLPTPKDIP